MWLEHGAKRVLPTSDTSGAAGFEYGVDWLLAMIVICLDEGILQGKIFP